MALIKKAPLVKRIVIGVIVLIILMIMWPFVIVAPGYTGVVDGAALAAWLSIRQIRQEIVFFNYLTIKKRNRRQVARNNISYYEGGLS